MWQIGVVEMGQVRLETAAGVATITLDRPDALNAFTDVMEAELIAALDACDADDEVRAVILTGAGHAFCAGMDLSDSSDAFNTWRGSAQAPPGSTFPVPGEDLPLRRDGGGRVVLRMFDMDKPLIAAVNGAAVGVGATMLLAADIRLAAETARFGFVFTRRGVTPESCSSWFLPRVVPMQTALEWMLTGRVFPAAEALERGLLRSVHQASELMPAANALAAEIASNTSLVATALARRMMWRTLGASHPMVAHHAETLALNVRGGSRDVRDGIAGFLERRTPVFEDRLPGDVPEVLQLLPDVHFEPRLLREAVARDSTNGRVS